jgi:hypothetical protein
MHKSVAVNARASRVLVVYEFQADTCLQRAIEDDAKAEQTFQDDFSMSQPKQ